MDRSRTPTTPHVWAGVALVAIALVSRDAGAAVDPFLCYRAKTERGTSFPTVSGVPLTDELGSGGVAVKTPKHLCSPAGIDGGPVGDTATHLQSHKIKRSPGERKHVRRTGIKVVNALGEIVVDTVRPELLFVPTTQDPGSPPAPPDNGAHDVDHYRCYRTKLSAASPAFPAGTQVTVADGFTTPRLLDVRKPTHLCLAVDADGQQIKNPADHVMCYRARHAAGEAKHTKLRGVNTSNEFGASVLRTIREQMLCLPSAATPHCNGALELCDRRFDEVAYPTSHNAMSNAEEGWTGPNQNFGITRQITDGVRGLMLDTYYNEGDVHLCHVFCSLGNELLVDGLGKITAFLDAHPYEVLTIIFESYISAADTAAAFAASGLDQYVHTQPLPGSWPTLRQMIESNERLVVLTDDSDDGGFAWYHYVWDFSWETPFSFEAPEDLTCEENRGSSDNDLFIVNHFLTQIFGSPELAEMINFDPLFIDRAEQCRDESGQLPNFVTVDFYDIGDVFHVVDALNGL